MQSYASYSLKKIFNVHDLDLAKVAKAFGFAVPPAVNLPVGSVKAPKKRRHDGEGGGEVEEDEAEEEEEVSRSERKGRDHRRKDTMGRKQAEKEVYRPRQAMEGSAQWSR